jgi:hydroxymethylpyrimidine/phosphomethylpyrimidine kinase
MPTAPPVVLSLSGHDPTGGAGIAADIETLGRLGCYPCTVVTALTVQDTSNVVRLLPQQPADFLEQARTVLRDLPVAAVKIGLLGSAELAGAVAELLLGEAAGLPVVLDPILAAGGGRNLSNEDLIQAIRERLLPLATVATPNIPEARRLAGLEDADSAARALLALGCPNVLLTGAHADAAEVVNRLYSAAGVEALAWPRLPGDYHGSGCTLAAAVAAGLAQRLPVGTAVAAAQEFTWNALDRAFALGGGQKLPNRLAGSVS